MATPLLPVILSGGAGTRLWPVSRQAYPKPFIRLADQHSLLQKALLRAAALETVPAMYLLTQREYYFSSRDHCSELAMDNLPELHYLLEPCCRNTAPAIALAALVVRERFGAEAQLLVLPADHLINDEQTFVSQVQQASQLASDGYLLTFGVPVKEAASGYGYIEPGQALEHGAYRVKRFIEKPNARKAQRYLRSGQFYWNAGIFCFRVDIFLDALARYASDIDQAIQAVWAATPVESPLLFDKRSFAAVPERSIDYAVMEHAERVAVLPAHFDWSDIGTWSALADTVSADTQGNRIAADALLIDSHDCFIHSEHRLVAAVGVEHLMIVDTDDALLVVDKASVQAVKTVVGELKQRHHPAYQTHRTVYRPWGSYTVLEHSQRYQIKRLVVKPGKALSLQMHHHRSEHWVVVSGTATVTREQQTWLLRTDESTYIPAGVRHRLANDGVIGLVMIEVQSGDYLGEDDIVRLDDVFGRHCLGLTE